VARPTGTEVPPGQQIAIAAEVRTSSEIQSIQWTAKDGGELSNDEGQSVIYTVPDTPGKYNVDVAITNKSGSTYQTVTFEVVVTPTEMAAVPPAEPSPIATAELTAKEEPAETPTKEPITASTEFPSPGTSTPPRPPVSSYAIAKAIHVDTPPVIDGRLDDQVWTQAEPLTYAEHPLVNDSTKMVVRLLWDNRYLYLGFDVSDTQVEGSSNENVWDGDSVGVIIENGGAIQEHRYSMPPPDRAGATDNIETVNRVAG